MKQSIFLLLILTLFCGCAAGQVSLRPHENLVGLRAGTFDQLDRQIEGEQNRFGIPGGALLIAKDGRLVYEEYFGRSSLEPNAMPIRRQSQFDLASLTKPLAAIPVVHMITGDSPDFGGVDQPLFLMLNHATGRYEEFTWQMMEERGMEALLSDPQLAYQPGNRSAYHNSSFLELNARAREGFQRYDEISQLLMERYWEPTNATGFTWEPTSPVCTGFRNSGELLCGEPFDPLAAYLVRQGLPAYHSGLFGRGIDVMRFANAIMRPESMPAQPALYNLFFTQTNGWRVFEPGVSDAGVVFRSLGGIESFNAPPYTFRGTDMGKVFVQTGYTGCLLWMVPEERFIVVLLTNASLTESEEAFEKFSEAIMLTILQGWDS